MDIIMRTVIPDNGVYMTRAVADEEVDKSIETLVAMLRVPRWLRVLIAWGTSNNFRYLGTRLKAWTGTTVEAVQLKLAWNQLVDRTLKQWRAASTCSCCPASCVRRRRMT
ncbi:uncharacterized protein LOC119108436 [Pollicipes pollicipes]|uniref:uncharacterized protein LOC119108436 n=1 Tax=Pollicipes pollicipes TaxID=41117 RepID=UPI001884E6EF|nr:uncharacterized protein LOC119108436 [Pollicipes pollicipes]